MPARQRSRRSPGALELWRAEARLRYDRTAALTALEWCFAAGTAPEGLEGPLDGRLITTTMGRVRDVVAEVATRAWMPWEGKVFDAAAAEGRNRFAPSARGPFRLAWPRLDDLRPDGSGGVTAFGFDTSVGPSATHPETAVLRLDYARPSGPWPVRLVLDELVAVGDGQHLGQALVWWRGRRRRAAWFALEPSRSV